MTSAVAGATMAHVFAELVSIGLRPVVVVLAEGRRAERWARHGVGGATSAGALAGLDALLGSTFVDEAVDRILDSPAAERAAGTALGGRLVDAVARDLARYAVLERVAEPLLAGEVLERTLARAESAGLSQRLADQLLADGAAERVAERLLAGPELERLVTHAVESPTMEQLLARVIDSELLGEVVAGLLEREELWTLVEEVAGSPAVASAITQQGVGFAGEVAGEVRERSEHADAWLERKAWRMLHWRGRARPPPAAPGEAGLS
jgi:hypothetical protein